MRAIFAVGDASSAARYLAGRTVLASYAYWGTSWLRGFEAHLPLFSGLVIDSGAFTSWQRVQKGQSPRATTVEEYAQWLVESAPPCLWALTLDVIGDAAASLDQYGRLAKLVSGRVAVVPVFHEGSPPEHLDAYVASSDLVAVGRTDGRRSERKTLEFYDSVFNRWPDGKFHALGNSNPKTLEPYPFASFDSTSWQRDAAYSEAAGWPWSRTSKETRIRAYVEAIETISHRPPKQLRLL